MDIIEELKYYCNEPQPVGAIMLTGEWGCGKTYLLNYEGYTYIYTFESIWDRINRGYS